MENKQHVLTIEELAALTGISTTMVSFYVRAKLLDPPDQTVRGSSYSGRHIQRISKIQTCQAEGMGRAEILQQVRGFRNPWYCQG